jgi:hypothetical protein
MDSTTDLYGEAYETIATNFLSGELGLLIGAGMSADEDGAPVAKDLSAKMLRRAVLGPGHEEDKTHPEFDKLASKYPFEAVAGYLVSKLAHGENDLPDWLREEGGLGGPLKNPVAQRALHELYVHQPQRFPRHIFTTNFDTFIEDEFEEDEVCCITSLNVIDLVKARKRNQIAVVHLHGCVRYPGSLVYGEIALATEEGPIFDLFRSALALDSFALVGYSMTDTNLRNAFFEAQRVAATRKGLTKRTFAVSPASGAAYDPKSSAGLAKEIWHQRGVEHIAATAGTFFTTLFNAVDNFVEVHVRQAVARHLGKDEETLAKMLESACEPFGLLKPTDLLVYLYYALVPRIGEKV